MKAVLHHDIGSGIRRLVSAVDPSAAEIVVGGATDGGARRRGLSDAEVLLHVLTPVGAATMDIGPRLRLIQKIGVGVDTIDIEAAKARGIAVCNMPGTNTQAVVEMTLALLFACLRRIVPIDAETRAGRGWPIDSRFIEGVGEVSGKTVGLVGYGAVSQRLTPVLQALGARVVASTRRAAETPVEVLPLEEPLRQAEIVSLHVPLTPETKGLLDAGRIGLMKSGAILVNTARGPLVEEAALVAALKSGHIAAAGLDVFPQEPPAPDSELLKLPNVVATPHLAWLTEGTWQRSLEVVVEQCRRLAAGGELLHRVA